MKAVSDAHSGAELGVPVAANSTDSVPFLPSSTPLVKDCAYVHTAQQRVEAMRSSQGDLLEAPTLAELENTLGKRVRNCELRAQNWRNRVYFIKCEDGTSCVA